uniref:(northern house mosquito) hypothetical protein n=1 Tax=Culex pipiens TaxID=7175 RepID=A0A8D8NN95_CULPI
MKTLFIDGIYQPRKRKSLSCCTEPVLSRNLPESPTYGHLPTPRCFRYLLVPQPWLSIVVTIESFKAGSGDVLARRQPNANKVFGCKNKCFAPGYDQNNHALGMQIGLIIDCRRTNRWILV